MRRLTAQHDPAEHGVVALQGTAVPAVMAELVLALADPLLRPLPDRLHDVRVLLAELPLLVHQPRDVITDHPRSQGSDIPAGSQADFRLLGYVASLLLPHSPTSLCRTAIAHDEAHGLKPAGIEDPSPDRLEETPVVN